jgi:glycosyltransferase involved in cell wall biosynthesis
MKKFIVKKIVPLNISIILATYNWPNALQAVLCALAAQKTTHLFEIIVADDGSNSETAQVICNFKQHNSINILHIWQPDVGFRLAAIRNKAILASRGDYILFLDGDCIPRENFIERHWQLAEWKTLVMGNRVLLNHEFTKTVLLDSVPLHQWSFWQWCWARLHRKCNRIPGGKERKAVI